MPLHEQEGVQVHEVRLRCGVSAQGVSAAPLYPERGLSACQLLKYLTHMYIAFSEAFRGYVLTDGTNNLATTESLDSTILHWINIEPQGHINHSFDHIVLQIFQVCAARAPPGRP